MTLLSKRKRQTRVRGCRFVATRKSAFGRLLDHFHTHPKGRLHEFLFFSAVALVVGGLDYWAWNAGQLSAPLALLVAIVAVCLLGFGLLPQKKPKAPPAPLPGKRGEIAQRVKAAKSAKRKGPPPPVG